MNTQAKMIIGVLVASVVALAITVAVMADGDDMYGNDSASAHMGTSDSGYQGMMGAMGSMDRDDMLKHMREVLGEDGYQRMLAHLADHRNGAPMTGNAAVDQMMHTMMDGMTQSMPMGSGTVLPPGNDQHHDSPTPATTPTP
jgi:hypothetical protein